MLAARAWWCWGKSICPGSPVRVRARALAATLDQTWSPSFENLVREVCE